MSTVANVTPASAGQIAEMPRSRVGHGSIRAVSSEVVELRVTELGAGFPFRERGIESDHTRVLAESPHSWPPILVNRADLRVIDGQHRVAAAHLIGRKTIAAELFDGSPEDAYLEFLRRNVQHGLPLSLRERRHAASRILGQWPNWSDRRVAVMCGLAPGTVASLRAEATPTVVSPSSDRSVRSEQRVGRDGKRRPTKPTVSRQRIAEALIADPSASLRAIAEEVGASPETVRSVRSQLRARPSDAALQASTLEASPLQPTPLQTSTVQATALVDLLPYKAPRSDKWWARDAALTSSPEGQRFVKWLSRSLIEEADWRAHLQTTPRSRVYELAAEARRRANCWAEFSETLEALARGTG
jgi:ParB-like chromosome segregation protein Spo0J